MSKRNPTKTEYRYDILAHAKGLGSPWEPRVKRDVTGDASTLNDLTAWLGAEIDKAKRMGAVLSQQFQRATGADRKRIDAKINAAHRLVQNLRYLEMRVEQLAEEVTSDEIAENPMRKKSKTKRKAAKKTSAKRAKKAAPRKRAKAKRPAAKKAKRKNPSRVEKIRAALTAAVRAYVAGQPYASAKAQRKAMAPMLRLQKRLDKATGRKTNPRGKVATGKTYRPKIRLSSGARKVIRRVLVQLMKQGHKQKDALATAIRFAREKGYKIPVMRNPLLGVMTLLGKLPITALSSNPGKARKAKRKNKAKRNPEQVGYRGHSGKIIGKITFKTRAEADAYFDSLMKRGESPVRRWLSDKWADTVTRRIAKKSKRANPSTATVRYLDMPKALRKRYRKAALMAAKFGGRGLRDVVFENVPTPAGFKKDHAFVEVGEEVRTQYRVRGSKSKRHGYLWDHRAGDNGKGKKKTKPALIVIDPKTGQRVLVARAGSRPGFSSERGLLG